MRITTLAVLLISAAAAASAQQWEVGAVGGAALFDQVNVSGAAGSAKAGFAPGFIAGAFIGQNMKSHLSGEIRYEFMQSDLRLSSGAQTARFSGMAHAVHYDFIYRSNRGEASVQFFVAAGGGLKAFYATGTESPTQPLSQYGYFTKAHSTMAMGTVAAGVNFRLGSSVTLRAEVRDFITGFPAAVLTPPPGVTYGSILNDVAPMVSIIYTK